MLASSSTKHSVVRPTALGAWYDNQKQQQQQQQQQQRRSFALPSTPRRPVRAPPRPPTPHTRVANVERLVLVGSAKGGVGKSTTAVNLALATQGLGRRVGLLDVDVYGPSLPTLMNLGEQRARVNDATGRLEPLRNFGVPCMSIGFLVPRHEAVAWRGPMVQSSIAQMALETDWASDSGERLDVLFVDLPPGTGDAQLAVSQMLKVDGAVIVSTPQLLALEDVRRGVSLFGKVDVPVLGLVENMSHHECTECGHVSHVFGRDGVSLVSKQLGLELLGGVPLSEPIRSNSDTGSPVVVSQPSSPEARAYVAIAKRLDEILAATTAATDT